jgi:signal transduction histidine kinase
VRDVRVALTGDDPAVELIVGDRGTGFDPSEVINRRGLGLTSNEATAEAGRWRGPVRHLGAVSAITSVFAQPSSQYR